MKALFAAGVPARSDREYFYQHTTGPPMPDRTLFEDVYQVPPGHYLVATRNSVRITCYWKFDYAPATELAASSRSEQSHIEEFCAVFEEEALADAGGRASRLLSQWWTRLLLGARLRGAAFHDPLRAFTLTFDQAAYDEREIARAMTAYANASFYPIPIKQADIAERFVDAIILGCKRQSAR